MRNRGIDAAKGRYITLLILMIMYRELYMAPLQIAHRDPGRHSNNKRAIKIYEKRKPGRGIPLREADTCCFPRKKL